MHPKEAIEVLKFIRGILTLLLIPLAFTDFAITNLIIITLLLIRERELEKRI